MRRMHRFVVLAALAAIAASLDASATPPPGRKFITHLTGDEEVPVRETIAVGQTIFKLNRDGNSMTYKLIVSDIENVVAAHIHAGVFGTNGPVVTFLAGPFASGGGPVEGIIGQGVITAANFVGPLAGQDFSVLLAAMRTGGTYVNVHTNDGIDPTNTGPGDFPGGEIRGQIRGVGVGKPAPIAP